MGFRNEDGVLQIHQHLIDHGINPMEITKVLMSHLHKDHSGAYPRQILLPGNVPSPFPMPPIMSTMKRCCMRWSMPANPIWQKTSYCCNSAIMWCLLPATALSTAIFIMN
ncbi:hypothetical protein [Chitinophaga oryzae]|uniref:hypothetical protein n=1 Tax=Chitinophaga oryzae TaxID=2725414 RepID=UPI001FE760FC|nr:hypothetical protein [Chitinophaga oryzae]